MRIVRMPSMTVRRMRSSVSAGMRVEMSAVAVSSVSASGVSVPRAAGAEAGNGHRAKPYDAEQETRDVQVHSMARDSSSAIAFDGDRAIGKSGRRSGGGGFLNDGRIIARTARPEGDDEEN